MSLHKLKIISGHPERTIKAITFKRKNDDKQSPRAESRGVYSKKVVMVRLRSP